MDSMFFKFSEDYRFFATFGTFGKEEIKIWDFSTGTLLHTFTMSQWPKSTFFTGEIVQCKYDENTTSFHLNKEIGFNWTLLGLSNFLPENELMDSNLLATIKSYD